MKIRYAIAAAVIACDAYINAAPAFAQPLLPLSPDCPIAADEIPQCVLPPSPTRAIRPIVGWWHHKGTLTRCDNPGVVLREISAELLFHADGTMVSVDTNPPASRQTAVGVWITLEHF